MNRPWILFPLLFLFGCGGNAALTASTESAHKTIAAVAKIVPPDCNPLRAVCDEQVDAVSQSCRVQLELKDAKIDKRNLIIIASWLLFILLLWIILKPRILK
jgi:hypothetical protein